MMLVIQPGEGLAVM